MAAMDTPPRNDRDLKISGQSDAEQAAQNCDYKQPDYEISNIDWVACKDFTADVGKQQIEEYISTWEMEPSWRFSVKLLQEKRLESDRQYHYKTCWSLPTPRCPIPKHTASVYFIISVSQTKPPRSPVLVQFHVESNRSIHVPGKTRFREKWLKDVIENKTVVMDAVTF